MAAIRPGVSPSPTNFRGMKQDPAVKPNPHPYAIRTTSTGVLTRSNSSGHNTAASKHHYVPLPTSPTRKREARLHHRPSKSLNTEESYFDLSAPQPLPVPSRFLKKASEDDLRSEQPRFVRRRAETLPPTLPSDATPLVPVEAGNLPANPKLWTPAQLASYLLSALPTQNADADETVIVPAPIIPAIAKFIQDTKISGRIFLRLNEGDMTTMGIDVSWREALLAAARNLRQNVLKGRIWGAGQDSPQPGALPSQPFSPLYDSYSSASSAELTTDDEDVGVAKRRKVRGRVRGLVESFERSGSFSSASDLDDEDLPPLGRADAKKWLAEKVVPEDAVVLSPTSPTKGPIALELPLAPAAPSVEEPSVEALLEEAEATSVGARAWEEFDMDAGVTVKRVVDAAAEDEGARVVDLAAGADKKTRSLPRNTPVKRKSDRRVVTAVFAPSSSASASPAEASPVEPPAPQDQAVQAADESGAEDADTLALLMAELQATRLQIAGLTQRLHDVEARNTALETLAASQEAELTKMRESPAADEVQPHIAAPQANPETCSHCGVSGRLGGPLDAPTPLSASSILLYGTSFLPAVVQRAIPAALRTRRIADDKDARKRRRPSSDEPSSMSEVPSYVLLVGLGVCAVVLRLMLKKAASRRS
ncbi:hypothetical protein PsYK624_017010 [Phanerochaete sordida]|uniref:Uncharacterized protein n=1 Tax=Phanerochaete sordida TaxID=48140 RepID=A0A9P3G009_9APHY|nr:hypothetical protein PsYK624_017010 [Phanerochaete sordida]